jgi:hypothetical protein
MIWKALVEDVRVFDATSFVTLVHQNRGYNVASGRITGNANDPLSMVPEDDQRPDEDPGHQVLDTPLGKRGANLPECVSLRARLHARLAAGNRGVRCV